MYPFARIPQNVRLPEAPRLVLTLALAGLFSGLAIVGAYRLTLPTIQANQAAALRRAVFEVLPGAERCSGSSGTGRQLAPAEATAADPDPAVYAGYGADGTLVGYAIPAVGAGYQDTISLIYGFDPAKRRIVGMQVLESRETPGLGDRILQRRVFLGAVPRPRGRAASRGGQGRRHRRQRGRRHHRRDHLVDRRWCASCATPTPSGWRGCRRRATRRRWPPSPRRRRRSGPAERRGGPIPPAKARSAATERRRERGTRNHPRDGEAVMATSSGGAYDEFVKGLWRENPIFVQVLGMCPALAVTNCAINGVAMGLATLFVLLCSSLLVSALRNLIPKQVRISTYIIIIATFVTVADYTLQAMAPDGAPSSSARSSR